MELVLLIVAITGGAGIGFGTHTVVHQRRTRESATAVEKARRDAEDNAKAIEKAAHQTATQIVEESKREHDERRKRLDAQEQRLATRDIKIDAKLAAHDQRQAQLQAEEAEIAAIKQELHDIRIRQQANLEKISKLKKEDARAKLMQLVEKDTRQDLLTLTEKLKDDVRRNADEYAREILSEAMARMASSQVAERTVTTVKLPEEDMKGRIIGKEGRNIQTLERLTGVDFLVDDTPGVVVLSSFDPIRRQVARVALEELLADGRIHPARIEEVVKKAEAEIDKTIKRAGEDAAREAKVLGLPPEINNTMGMLKFRTSYGQNVLHHSVEMAHLAAMIAAEIGADVHVARTAAYLHDLGKAVTHEVDGNHHHITGEYCRKYGLDETICHAAEAHHDDIEATTPEAMIVRAVDGLSGGRPGARGDNVERFVDRMKELENIAKTFAGVERVYAISAGREIRVFVSPENIDDLSALKLARDIATKVESMLKYPGTIKVNVIRETRAVEYAK